MVKPPPRVVQRGPSAGELGAVGAVLGGVRSGGVGGDLNAAGGLARLGADVAGSGSAAGATLAGAASGIGAAVGLYEGFQTGGVVGGAEAGLDATTALELAGAASGIGLPIAAGVALVAAIFGGNHDKPANMPDKYDTQRYGQDIADLQGVAGANGQNFTEDAQLKAALGGRTGIAAIEETLAQYGSASNAPSWLAGMFDKLKGMFGMSSTGSGTLNFEHVIKYEWVSGAQGTDGQHYTYTDLAQALADFANAELTAGAAPASASASPQLRTLPSMRFRPGSASAAATEASTNAQSAASRSSPTPAQLEIAAACYNRASRVDQDQVRGHLVL